MTLSRRDLLRSLLALPVAATVDWEQLLWVPKPQIVVPQLPFIPKYYSVSVPITLDEINAITMKNMVPGIVDSFFRTDPLLKYFQERGLAL